MRRWILLLSLLIFCVLAFVAKTLWDAGEFRSLKPLLPGACREIGGVPSSEDITIDRQAGIALISAADRRGGGPGDIFTFDLKRPDARPVRLPRDLPEDFQPHGISLFQPGTGEHRLLAINHRSDGPFVEVFDYQPDRLVHLRSIRSPLMHSPNDLVATGPESFYVTNDHRESGGWRRKVEEYLQQARSYVLYFDGFEFTIAASGLAYANGVNLSPDGKQVYVAASVGRTVSIFQRNPATNHLQLEQVIDAGTGVDNIEVDPEGALWIGAHPKLLTFVSYMADPGALSPSEVIRIRLFPKRGFQIDPVLVDSGSLISASSVAAPFRDRLLVGSVADPKFLICEQ